MPAFTGYRRLRGRTADVVRESLRAWESDNGICAEPSFGAGDLEYEYRMEGDEVEDFGMHEDRGNWEEF